MHLLVTCPAELAKARAIVDAELDAIELAASRFRADSEVCALASAGGRRRPVSAVFGELIEAALTAAEMTDGDVDPTVGAALIDLGYDQAMGGSPVAGPRLASLVVPVDWRAVEYDGTGIRLPAGTLLDLGATAKAVAADRCASRVSRETGTGVLVNLGGRYRDGGTPAAGRLAGPGAGHRRRSGEPGDTRR
jgi:thiamine biosynthesis lipoprotein